MKNKIIVIMLLIGLTAWQCTKIDRKPDLKQSLMSGVDNINTAISKISTSKGYELLSVSAAGNETGVDVSSGTDTKSVEGFDLTDSITLDMVAGVYDFQPDFTRFWHHYFPVSLFKKTGESDHLIVNMPHRMMFRPRYLFNFGINDTIPPNNFTIDASAWHLFREGWYSLDYNLVASFSYEDADIGVCDINSLMDPVEGKSFTSEFVFPEGFGITVEQNAVDTARSSSFALMDGNDILLKESSVISKTGFRMFERQYILTIGEVEIKRTTGIDSIQVFVDGVLQQKAAVKIVDDDDDGDKSGDHNNSICYSRDLLITFDDGTTANLSDLISPALGTLKTLVISLGDMYFARRIVDYIALSIEVSSH